MLFALTFAPPSWVAWMSRSSADTNAPPPSSSDAFLQRLEQRDERALGELFDRHAPRLERVLLRVMGPDPDLTDVVQDSFEQALRSLSRFEGDADDLGAWLRRIAINVAKNRLRHRRVRRWLGRAVPYESSEVASRVASPDVVHAMRRTYEVLERLPPQERIAFTLRFIDGMQLAEIADATGMSLATVKRRIAKARERVSRHARKDAVLSGWLEGGDA